MHQVCFFMHDLGAVELSADAAFAVGAAGRNDGQAIFVASLFEQIKLKLRCADRCQPQVVKACGDLLQYHPRVKFPGRSVLGVELQENLRRWPVQPGQWADGFLDGRADAVAIPGLPAQRRHVTAPDVTRNGGERHLELAIEHLVDAGDRQPLAAVNAVQVGQHDLENFGFGKRCQKALHPG